MKAMDPAWSCPCGCALQLSRSDIGDAMWLASLVGEGGGSSWTPPAPITYRADPPEPTINGKCRRCGITFEIVEYLGEFMLSHAGAVWCQVCTKGGV